LSRDDGNGENKRRRGRPIGFRLSEESKKAISDSKKGQKHTQETKDKISRSLILYFRKLNPFSDEIEKRYCRMDDDEACDWVHEVRSDLNSLNDVMTDRAMRNTRRIELTCGNYIEFFGHEMTPETILLFKEFCKLRGLDPNNVYDKL
jgi:NUMOD3 motif